MPIDEAQKHERRDKELIKESIEKHKTTIPKGKQIECPNCKTLNESNSVLCVSCGENMVAFKHKVIKDYSVIHKADKRRKH